MTQQTPELPPIKLAFVLEGEVVDVLYTDERLSAIFTSSPTVIDVTDLINNDKDSKVTNLDNLQYWDATTNNNNNLNQTFNNNSDGNNNIMNPNHDTIATHKYNTT